MEEFQSEIKAKKEMIDKLKLSIKEKEGMNYIYRPIYVLCIYWNTLINVHYNFIQYIIR